MGLTELIFQVTPAQVGSITLDASVRENHSATAKVTRHPIQAEEGSQSTVTDHVIVDPLTITIDGVVSGHPAETAAYLQNLFSGGGRDPVREAHQTMLDDLLTGRLVTVITNLLEYPNMVLESVNVVREAKTGNSLHFTATATQVTLVRLETIDVEVRAPRRATKKGGKKPKRTVTKEEKTSVAGKAVNAAAARLGSGFRI